MAKIDAKAAAIVREEDLEDMREIAKELQDHLEKARGDGRVYLMSHLTRAVAMFKSEVARLDARFSREQLAQYRKEEKDLRKQIRAAQDGDDTEDDIEE